MTPALTKTTTLIGSLVVTLSLAASVSFAASVDSPTIAPWHAIGNIGIGMDRTAVEYRYGQNPISTYGFQWYYKTADGKHLFFSYGTPSTGSGNRVIEVGTDDPRYKTSDGLAVGTAIPLGRCSPGYRVSVQSFPKWVRVNCVYHWHGFTLSRDPTVGNQAWFRKSVFGGRHLLVELNMYLGKVYSIAIRQL